MNRNIAIAMALAMALAVAGCSLAMATVPDRWDGTTPPRCSDSGVAPGVDLAVGTVALLAAGAALISHAACDDDFLCGVQVVVWLPALVVGAPYFLSGLSGRSKAAKCKSARRQYEEQRMSPEQKARKHEEKQELQRKNRQRCAAPIAAWRRERDQFKKFGLWDRMPEVCRELAETGK